MEIIRELHGESDLLGCVQLLRSAFGTVAIEFGLTETSAPTNPAYVTIEKLTEYLWKPVVLYGLFCEEALAGCIVIESSKQDKDTFYIERLAVSPAQRHHGYGALLLDFALNKIKESGGTIASIGLMDNNDRLKTWYQTKGFVQTGCKSIEYLPFKVCFMSKTLAVD